VIFILEKSGNSSRLRQSDHTLAMVISKTSLPIFQAIDCTRQLQLNVITLLY